MTSHSKESRFFFPLSVCNDASFFLNGAPKPSNRRKFSTRTVYRESLGINWSCVWTTLIRYPTNDRWWVGEPTRKVRSTCLTEINRSWWYLERFVFYAPRLHLSSRSRWDERISREDRNVRFVMCQKLFVHLMNSEEVIKIVIILFRGKYKFYISIWNCIENTTGRKY